MAMPEPAKHPTPPPTPVQAAPEPQAPADAMVELKEREVAALESIARTLVQIRERSSMGGPGL